MNDDAFQHFPLLIELVSILFIEYAYNLLMYELLIEYKYL